MFFETKDMYGLGHVSTQYSTKITPKTSNTYQSAKTTTFTNLRTFKAASPIYILLIKSSDSMPYHHIWYSYLHPIIWYSYLHLQTWRPATLGASSRRGVSGGVEGHHWEYNPFLVQSTVHTVFTPMLSSYMGRVKLLHHGAHIHCFYRPHITCCWQNFLTDILDVCNQTRPTRKHVLPKYHSYLQA